MRGSGKEGKKKKIGRKRERREKCCVVSEWVKCNDLKTGPDRPV